MKRRILISIFIFFVLIFSYSILFVAIMHIFEGQDYTFVEGVYWVISTITTVGYGDITFTSQIGKIFSIVVMMSGVMFFFGFLVPYAVIPWAEQRLRLSLPTEVKMTEHLIICGYNRFTKEFCKILKEFGIRYVVVERDENSVRKALSDGINCIYSDGSIESFRKSGIERATSVVVAWGDVEAILDTLLTLRNYSIPKYVVYGDHRYTKYLLYAGATKVFLPKSLIASSMARTILEEIHIGKIEEVLGGLYTAEIVMPKSMKVSELEEKGLRVIAKCKLGGLEFNPGSDAALEKGSVVLLAGSMEALRGVMYEGTHLRLR